MDTDSISGRKRSLEADSTPLPRPKVPKLQDLADVKVTANLLAAKNNKKKGWPVSVSTTPRLPLKKDLQDLLKQLPDIGKRRDIHEQIHSELIYNVNLTPDNRKHLLGELQKFPKMEDCMYYFLEKFYELNDPEQFSHDPEIPEQDYEDGDQVQLPFKKSRVIAIIFRQLPSCSDEEKRYVLDTMAARPDLLSKENLSKAYELDDRSFFSQVEFEPSWDIDYAFDLMCDPVVTESDYRDGAFKSLIECVFGKGNVEYHIDFTDYYSFSAERFYESLSGYSKLFNYLVKEGLIQPKLTELTHSHDYQEEYPRTKTYVKTYTDGRSPELVWAEPQSEDVPVMTVEELEAAGMI